MSSLAAYFNDLSEHAGAGWNRFWFTPASTLPLARMRIAVGLLALAYFLSWSGDLVRVLGGDGLLPPAMVRSLLEEQNRHLYRPSPLFQLAGPSELAAFHLAAIAVSILFLAGVFTRATSVLTLAALLSIVHRAPMLTGPVETLLTMLLLYLAVGPSGAAWSVDAWLARRQGKSPAAASWLAAVALRLIQVHLAGLLFLVACSCLSSLAWWNGTAIWALAGQEYARPFDLSLLRSMPKLVNAWTHLFVLVNLLFPALVWVKVLRPLVLAATAAMWVAMLLVSGQFLYIAAMLVAMTAFLAKDPQS